MNTTVIGTVSTCGSPCLCWLILIAGLIGFRITQEKGETVFSRVSEKINWGNGRPALNVDDSISGPGSD